MVMFNLPRSSSSLLCAAFIAAASLGTPANAQRIKLNAPLDRVAVGDVLALRVSTDRQFLVYAADPDGSGTIRLYRAGLNGSTPVVDLGVSFASSRRPRLSTSARTA